MTEPALRNHPTMLVKNILLVVVIMFFVLLSTSTTGYLPAMLIIAVVTVLLSLIMVLYWARTTITFTEDEAIVESNVFYKKKKTIPYKKIASVNVVRDIFNRIFGTTTLSININSSQNAAVPEASFVFEAGLAEQIRNELTSRLFDEKTPEEGETYESLISFTNKDVVLHSFFGTSTYQLLFAIAMVAYSVISVMFLEGTGIVWSLILLVIGEIIPVGFTILKYGNFKVYRINDQIHLQHGILQKYVSKFDVNRINAKRIKRTYFARFMGRSSLEAEVVGINAVADEVHPLLCLMADNEKIEALIKELVPEFIHEPEMEKQPRKARLPILMKASVGSIITILIMAYPCYWMYLNGTTLMQEYSSLEEMLLRYTLIVATLVVVLGLFYAAHVSFKIREFGMGKDMFNMVNGLLDREIMIIQYDRVQITEVAAGLMPRRLGLARCTVSLLSSQGYRNIRSGYFDRDTLYQIGEMMLQRLRDGEYRYMKNSI